MDLSIGLKKNIDQWIQAIHVENNNEEYVLNSRTARLNINDCQREVPRSPRAPASHHEEWTPFLHLLDETAWSALSSRRSTVVSHHVRMAAKTYTVKCSTTCGRNLTNVFSKSLPDHLSLPDQIFFSRFVKFWQRTQIYQRLHAVTNFQAQLLWWWPKKPNQVLVAEWIG
jgi:hypothetical protein